MCGTQQKIYTEHTTPGTTPNLHTEQYDTDIEQIRVCIVNSLSGGTGLLCTYLLFFLPMDPPGTKEGAVGSGMPTMP